MPAVVFLLSLALWWPVPAPPFGPPLFAGVGGAVGVGVVTHSGEMFGLTDPPV